MQVLTTPVDPILICLPPLIAGFLCRRIGARAGGRMAVVAAGCSALLAHGLVISRAAGWQMADPVSSVMVLLVTYLGAVVLRYSRHYLAGDPAQARFFSWMSFTLAAVLSLVVSGNLLILLTAWVATSLCLHRLLLHHPGRAGAVFAARKKFVFSRAGDLCLLAASLLLYRSFGTWDIGQITASVAAGHSGGLTAAALLLVACAALKSAQFPFHSWLPDTMETPTPVSAFMHAGIINAGGFLIVRFSPVIAQVPAALHLLALTGTVTAAFGAVVMLAQPGVKRALAYSTIAQMGFMMLQCGLGAFGLALIHIAAHSLYKAHAFLTSGSTVGAVPRAAVPLATPALACGVLGSGLLVTTALTVLHEIAPDMPSHPRVFAVVLVLALAYGLARAGSAGGGSVMIARAAATAVVICAVTLSLHVIAHMLAPAAAVPETPVWLGAFVTGVFVALFLFQVLLWRTGRHPMGRRLYVHALNGFYLGTIANRLLGRLWPHHPVS